MSRALLLILLFGLALVYTTQAIWFLRTQMRYWHYLQASRGLRLFVVAIVLLLSALLWFVVILFGLNL